MKLSERTMLVSLNLRLWSARRVDRKVTREVHSAHNAKANAGRYNKCLIDPDAESFRAIQTKANEIRAVHYKNTLPWAQDGAQILSADNFYEYSDRMGRFSPEFDRAVDAFVADYPRLVEQARIDLNGMFNEADYPSADSIRQRYEFKTVVLPMPEAGDFRSKIGNAHADVIRAQIEENLKAAQGEAMREVWERLFTPVKHMAEILSDPARTKKSKDSLVGNIAEMVEVLPRLNIANDENLNAMCEEVRRELTTVSATVIRNVDTSRADIAAKANALANKMSALMESF